MSCIAEIFPHIYIGNINQYCSNELRNARHMGITHVMNVGLPTVPTEEGLHLSDEFDEYSSYLNNKFKMFIY